MMPPATPGVSSSYPNAATGGHGPHTPMIPNTPFNPTTPFNPATPHNPTTPYTGSGSMDNRPQRKFCDFLIFLIYIFFHTNVVGFFFS
jgi:hypothetical protein